VVRGLQKSVLGRTILSVWIGKERFHRPIPAECTAEWTKKSRRSKRFGKFIAVALGRRPKETSVAKANSSIVVAAGVADASTNTSVSASATGKQQQRRIYGALLVHRHDWSALRRVAAQIPFNKHTHVSLTLDDGRELRYNRPAPVRAHGGISQASCRERSCGAGGRSTRSEPPPNSPSAFARGNVRIKALLLDQSVFRGVGNIYADESLWRARFIRRVWAQS